MVLRLCVSIAVTLWITAIPFSSAQKVRYEALKAADAPILDGIVNDACWNGGNWGQMGQQWFPDRNMPDSADFYGRYKAVWTPAKLYLLLEITDDVLLDDIEDPLTNYWEDDCIEVFIDEDNSGGDHQCCSQAYNAFAYHISPVTLDAVDLSDDGDFVPKLYNGNVDIAVRSTGNLHTVEIAIELFDDAFDEDSENTPVTITPGKLMGFSIAYCDDDGNGREDFLATQPGGLDSWMNADLFGELLLLDNPVTGFADSRDQMVLFPNPATDQLIIGESLAGKQCFEILDQKGSVVKVVESEQVISLHGIQKGIYFIRKAGAGKQPAFKFIVL